MDDRTKFIAYSISLAALLAILTPLVLNLDRLIYFYTGSKILSVVIFSVYALISGYLFSRVFQNYGGLKVIISGVIGSLVFAVMLGVRKVIQNSLKAILQSELSLQNGNLNSIANTEGMINPDLLFIIIFISFNLPIIYSLIERNDLEPKYMVLYALSILFYLIISLMFNEVF